MATDNRWEQGSEHHLSPWSAPEFAVPSPWGGRALLTGSGRDALKLLLRFGVERRRWRRLWLPSYFCQDVITALHTPALELRVYPYAPDEPEPDLNGVSLGPGDVVLAINFFGLRSTPPAGYSELPEGVELIEDHTHDPWSRWAFKSRSTWCVASLRKTIPLSDGGVLWSPKGTELPPAPALTDYHRRWAAEKLAGMALKALYLQGAPVEKEVFRPMMVEAEAAFGAGAPSAISPWAASHLAAFPVTAWREQRTANYCALAAGIRTLPGLKVLEGAADSCPSSVVIVFDTAEHRERVRSKLIASAIFPAVLWSLSSPCVPGIPERHRELASRILALHCDARYGVSDLHRVLERISALG